MLPLKRILCPTDFSADSQAALRVAGEMALYFSAELTVLHVQLPVQPAIWPYEGLGVNPIEPGLGRDEAIALREKELVVEADEALPEGIDLKLEVVEGDPAEVILDVARRKRCDMIVLAPHGHNRLRTAIFGSTAEKVIKEASCPVVTMHAGQELGTRSTGSMAQEAES